MEKKRQNRTVDCKPRFVNGYAENWYMAVPDVFKQELDIILTERIENKIKVKRWTQGIPPLYNFKEGHIIFDTPKAYSGEWSEALKHIKIMVQIERGIPDTFDMNKGYCNGHVFVKFYRPNKDKTKIEQVETAEFTQKNFVHFLQTGEIKKLPPIHPEFVKGP